MNEKMFAPENTEGAENKEDKTLKYIEADRDGVCTECHEAYKKGDKIALYKSKDEVKFDEEKGADTSPSPYHTGCVDEIILREKEKE